MNAPSQASQAALQQADALAQCVADACERIAPTWPLDQFIAVNPYLGWTSQPVQRAAAELALLCGTRLTMPRAWFRAQLDSGLIRPEHLRAAAERSAAGLRLDELRAAADTAEAQPLPLLTDLRDACDHLPHGMHWSELITHQISQHCAAYFDSDQARWRLHAGDGLYASWRRQLAADRGLTWRQGRGWLAQRLQTLPDDPLALIADALGALRLHESAHTAYLSALLLSINGWAAWCAWLRWQARLHGGDDGHLVQLLAVRLAWEWLLLDDAPQRLPLADWGARWERADALAERQAEAARVNWALQDALEIGYQQQLARGLLSAPDAPDEPAPAVQAVFCIDVRSELLRRALERVTPLVHTRGFAGFFGLPIAYSPAGSDLGRPQLPALLAPAHEVSEEPQAPSLAQAWRRRRQAVLQWRRRWAELRGAPASAFTFVESCGLFYGAKLWADGLASTAAPSRWEDTGLPVEDRGARPRLALVQNDPAAAADMARGVLKAMGLTREFAPLVLLVGHGSQSANNAHAAGLGCGACGGQSGDVNARVLADLLNAPAVREALRKRHGVDIPPSTHFLPALHNTTTDDVALLDTDALADEREPELQALRHWLTQAGHRARAERAPSLGLAELAREPEKLAQAVRRRANDWAQVRPEWGLANNAAFIAAPRARSRHLRLDGRCFLHDYDWSSDTDNATLELVMTAPMVVASWINLQYHASTVDNHRWGSGNKTLHNVVGGRIGVFEGNGGDLRIGLPLQSLHDGHALRHTPQRLSVFIEAPRERINAVLQRHPGVRELVHHGWLHLLCLDPQDRCVLQLLDGQWRGMAAAA